MQNGDVSIITFHFGQLFGCNGSTAQKCRNKTEKKSLLKYFLLSHIFHHQRGHKYFHERQKKFHKSGVAAAA